MSTSSLFSSSTAPAAAEPSQKNPVAINSNQTGNISLWRSGFVLLLALMVGLSYWFNPPMVVQPQAGVVMDLPVILGDYLGKKGEITEAELTSLPKDTQFARRNYDDDHGHEITCTIVLSGAEQRSIHRPEACMEGQGWTITKESKLPIPLPSGHLLTAEEITLERRVIAPNGDHITLGAFYDYWFVGENVTTSSEMRRVLLSNWDRFFFNRAHRWAYVSLFTLVTGNLRPDGLSADQTRQLLVNFTRQIAPTFQISEMPSQAKD